MNDFVHLDPGDEASQKDDISVFVEPSAEPERVQRIRKECCIACPTFWNAGRLHGPVLGPQMRLAFITFATGGCPLAGIEKDALDFVALRLNNWLSENVDNCKPPELAAENSLAPHEIETLYLLMKGNNYKQIAYLSLLSTRTVESYVATATKKLKVHNRTEAILRALELGYINPAE